MQHLSKTYPVWLCDIWGVVHNGVAAFAPAVKALARHRQAGGHVVLVTNAPRLSGSVEHQLVRLGAGPAAYDRIVTSGEVTRHLIAAHGTAGVHHIGPERDLGIFDGLGVRRVPLDEAAAVVCTGLFDDTVETAADYEERFERMIAKRLEMICANPDKVVRRGRHLIPCAGALAERYEAMGGKVEMAGKPYRPIYELALDHAEELRGKRPRLSEVLAIGDGPDTDIAGAASMGIDALLIAGGISEHDDAESFERHVRRRIPAARIVETMAELAW